MASGRTGLSREHVPSTLPGVLALKALCAMSWATSSGAACSAFLSTAPLTFSPRLLEVLTPSFIQTHSRYTCGATLSASPEPRARGVDVQKQLEYEEELCRCHVRCGPVCEEALE